MSRRSGGAAHLFVPFLSISFAFNEFGAHRIRRAQIVSDLLMSRDRLRRFSRAARPVRRDRRTLPRWRKPDWSMAAHL